jgi:hypothetical protein
MNAAAHRRLQELGGALVRALVNERDFEWEQTRTIVLDLQTLLDGDLCEECGAIIPNEDGGSLVNPHHKESCSLHGEDRHAERTVGDALAPGLESNTTAEDALARLNLAKVGSLVTPAGQPLAVPHLSYLRTLRNALFVFSDEVEREIARVEREAQRARERAHV